MASPAIPPPTIPPPKRRPPKTVDDYLALGDDVRAELIAGELFMTPAPSSEHQRVVVRLLTRLVAIVERAAKGEVIVSPLDVYLPSGDVVQPDLVIVGAAQGDIVRPDGVHGVPQFLIEVVSPSHPERDRIVKLQRYAENGVEEFWLVDPMARSVEVFVLEGTRFVPRGWFTGDNRLVSPFLPELDLPVSRLFTARSLFNTT